MSEEHARPRRLEYDREVIARYYDDYGEREWTRFEESAMDAAGLEIHRRILAEWIRPGDRVLEVGAGPGRFTLQLAELGARILVSDVSPRQLELHAEKTAAIGHAIEDRAFLDVVDLSDLDDGSFDATVCYGGALSYVIGEIDRGIAELLRVTKPGGHVLLSVMSLLGAARAFLGAFPDLIERFGWRRAVTDVFATGDLDGEINNGHVLRMYRWRDLEAVLSRHPCRIVTASASNFLSVANDEAFTADPRWLDVEAEACREPGALDGGTHIIAVLERL